MTVLLYLFIGILFSLFFFLVPQKNTEDFRLFLFIILAWFPLFVVGIGLVSIKNKLFS